MYMLIVTLPLHKSRHLRTQFAYTELNARLSHSIRHLNTEQLQLLSTDIPTFQL
jgi:predicted amidophosphoribosyltransferase